jgi:hypothetical protein
MVYEKNVVGWWLIQVSHILKILQWLIIKKKYLLNLNMHKMLIWLKLWNKCVLIWINFKFNDLLEILVLEGEWHGPAVDSL